MKRQKIIEASAALCEQEKQKQKDRVQNNPTTIYNKASYASKPAVTAVPHQIPARTPFKPYVETVRLSTEDMTYQSIADESKIVLDARTGIRVCVCQVCKRPKSKDAFAVLPVDYKQKNVGVCKLCAEKSKT